MDAFLQTPICDIWYVHSWFSINGKPRAAHMRHKYGTNFGVFEWYPLWQRIMQKTSWTPDIQQFETAWGHRSWSYWNAWSSLPHATKTAPEYGAFFMSRHIYGTKSSRFDHNLMPLMAFLVRKFDVHIKVLDHPCLVKLDSLIMHLPTANSDRPIPSSLIMMSGVCILKFSSAMKHFWMDVCYHWK